MFSAKGRPADHPVIVHLADAAQLDLWAREVPQAARSLAAAFWPGPLTMVLRRSSRASDLVTGGLETVGLRVPGHPVAQRLLRELGSAIAAPSANRFGRVSPTTAAHGVEELDGAVDIILDGGPCRVGLESTIVDFSSGRLRILRPGGVTEQQIAEVLGSFPAPIDGQAPRVSGSLESHYAPRARVELARSSEMERRAKLLAGSGQRVAVLARLGEAGDWDERIVVLPAPQDDRQYAQVLYALLRLADAKGCDMILATLPEGEGIAAAIADRLRKAAGPRKSDHSAD
jgi:L-threonylcarbamoyladenylate synthase